MDLKGKLYQSHATGFSWSEQMHGLIAFQARNQDFLKGGYVDV